MDMPMGTTTSTGTMPSMTGMDMSGGGMSDDGSMMMMSMMFTVSARTPLFAEAWTPATDGQYAGTCIFLIALACVERLLLALRPVLESRVWGGAARRAAADDDDRLLAAATQKYHDDHRAVPGGHATVVAREMGRRWRGWKIGSSTARATFQLLISGVAYLLMLAVMTMNVGYFLSVLGGIWLGTFVLGHLAVEDHWSHP